jgi:5-methylcytosine-specific restriction endonuclease McrA
VKGKILKVCSYCKEEKGIDLFNRDSSKRDGHRAMCKVCWNDKKVYHNAKYKNNANGMNEEELRQYRIFQSMLSEVKQALKECEFKDKEEPRWKTHGIYTCFKCKVEKPLSMFFKDSKSNTGHDRKCKECASQAAATRVHKYRNSDHGKAKAKEYRLSNQDMIKANGRVGRSRRRARARNLDEKFTRIDMMEVMQRFNHSCFKCGNKDKLHIDHHVPLSKGGRLTFTNAVILCEHCNISKHNKDPEIFYIVKELIMLDKKYGVRRDSLFN